MSAARAFQVNEQDNVATLLSDLSIGPTEESVAVAVYGCGRDRSIQATGSIALGHKIALESIACGAPVIKYGVPIGVASADILTGDWVHLHNCHSTVDERSKHLDVETGVDKDTAYA